MTIPSDISELCNDPMGILDQYKDSGVKVIGYTCSYVPEEMIISAGIQPYRIPNLGANASALVPSFVCPFAGATLENMLRHEGLFSGFILAHTCDPMWRLYDILKKKINKPLFLLRVPHDTENELSLNFFNAELERLREFLERNFDAKIDETALSRSVELCNETRCLLKNIYMLNSGHKYNVNALDRFQIVLASLWMPKQEFNSKIKVSDVKNGQTAPKARLHITGTAIYDLDLIKTIEESGGFIASDDLCTGSRYFWENVEETEESISALAYRYLRKAPCPSHGPLERKLEYIDLMIKQFEAQGVITFTERFCDPILYDSVHIRNRLKEKHVPTMLIDYENAAQEIGRIKTRLEAFIESLGE